MSVHEKLGKTRFFLRSLEEEQKGWGEEWRVAVKQIIK